MIHETKQQDKLASLKLSRKIEQKLHSRNFTKFGFDLNPVVSAAAGLIIFLF
jgi:choline/glycine/proline betaine transport protein/BCCT family betaine/carnitine transporter